MYLARSEESQVLLCGRFQSSFLNYERCLKCRNEDASKESVATRILVFDFELCIGGWCLRVYTYRSFSLSLQVCVCYHRTVAEQQRPAVECSVGPRGDRSSESQ